MGWWKADPVPDTPQPTIVSSATPKAPFASHPPISSRDSAAACPVDPKTREIWLQQAKAKAQTQTQRPDLPPSHPPLPKQIPTTTAASPIPTLSAAKECSSNRIDQSLLPTTPPNDSTLKPSRPLSHERTISSIPRASPSSSSTPSPPTKASTTPANAESETGHHTSGNWIYPSESQFFHAVMRKQTSSSPESLAASISHIIPIHNAVNERAWHLIKTWEGNSSARCGGPKLLSFQGLGAGALSPKARLKSLWGYTEPFDRHDWVVERCDGSTVEYVIDFYQGKNDPSRDREGMLNFYLDVRPKLNTFEGWKMRAERLAGYR